MMTFSKFTREAQDGIRKFCADVHDDEMLPDDLGSSPEAWAWLLIQLKVAADRPEWFPKGKWAICQILEGHLMEEARALVWNSRGRWLK